MIVFPGRRSVGLKAATASSRVETLPMFVRSRPSRTRRTISISWARSHKTTSRPSSRPRAPPHFGPGLVTIIPPARLHQPWRGRVQTRRLAPTSRSVLLMVHFLGVTPLTGQGKNALLRGLFPHPAKPLRITLMQTWGSAAVLGGKITSLLPPEEDIRRRIKHVCLVPTFSSDRQHRPATSQLTIVKYQFDSQTAFLNDAS